MKSISLLASVAVASVVCLSTSCSSKSDGSKAGSGSGGSAGSGAGGTAGKDGGIETGGASSSTGGSASSTGGVTGATGGSGNEDGGGNADAGDGGTLPTGPKAVLCPDPDPFHPQPTSVSVQDAVLAKDDHWTADKVYLIFSDFAVDDHTLTVDAGTTICVAGDAQIRVGEGIDPGEIHLNGTADKPITITAFASSSDLTKPDAFHRGIKFDTYENSVVSYVNVWYGGPGGGSSAYAFELTDTARGTASATKPLLVDHLTVGEVQSYGFRVGTENGVDPASKIHFTGFAPHADGDPAVDSTAMLNYYAEKSVVAALTYDKANIPAAAQKIRLSTAAPPLIIHDDVELTNAGMPYWAESGGLKVSGQEENAIATMTIDAGVTLHVTDELLVGDTHEGNLVLAGTAAEPVILTSSEDTPASGDWEGIFFEADHFDPAKSKISHAQVLYAGISDPLSATQHVAQCGTTDLAAISVGGTQSVGYAGPTISDTLIAHSLSNGIASDSGDNGVHLTTDYTAAALNLTFQDIAGQNLVIGTCH